MAGRPRLLGRLPPWRLRATVGLLALALLLYSVWQLEQNRAGLVIERDAVGTIPVTVFKRAAPAAGPGPLVVIAHGFAGSQQLMQPLALTLARNGYTAVTFDFPGHGRNPAPMTGGLADPEASQRTLLAALERVTAWALPLAAPGAGYALLGHSMASDIVVRHAQAHAEVWATVALSLFAPSIVADTPGNSPRNLLIVDGALEPGMMHTEALRVIGRVAGAGAQPRRTYGRFDDGTARRAAFAGGVEHIAVLYSSETAAEAVAWLDRAQGRPVATQPFIAAYGPPLAGLLAGVLGLAWALARGLPRVAAEAASLHPTGWRWWRWRGFWPMVVVPALATPLLLWKLPSDQLPILLGDYLVLHFGLYGLLTAALLGWRGGPRLAPVRLAAMLAATVLVTAYGLLAVGLPVDNFLFNLSPPAVRWPVIAALAAGTLPWFLADEALTRSPRAPRGAYFATKLAFLLSLVAAIALNPGRLFFLALIVPAILVLFVVYGLFSRWTFRRTGHPLVAALANALVFAWFMALTFPLVA
jgi:hypothetical protein